MRTLLNAPPPKRPLGRTPLVLALATTSILAAAPLLGTPAPSGQTVLEHTALSAGQFPGTFTTYSPPELYGGGAPAETCFVCNSATADGVGSAAASVDPNNDINAATGDITSTDTLFDVHDVGPDLKLDLSYSSQWAQSQQANHQSFPGAYGWGWGSNYNVSVSNSSGNVTVTDVNDSKMTFNLPGYQDSCPVGDYEDFQKYTYPFSSQPYCAPQRVDAQLGLLPAYNAYQLAENGSKQVYVFSSLTGSLIDEGNANSNADLSINNSVSPGSSGCPSGTSGCDIVTDSAGSSTGHTIIEVVNSGLITQVIDPAGNAYNLGFTSGYLTSVQNAAHGATSYFGYNNTNPSPYNAELASVQDPNAHITQLRYNSIGMATDEIDPLNNDIRYAYGNLTCTNSCLDSGESQMTTVTYPDGETDVDHYYEGLLTASSFGSSSTSNADFETWTYNYTFPSASNQDGDTVEEIVHPGAAQSTSVTQVTMDSVGNVLSSQDVNGNVTQTMYNDTGGNNLDELCWSARPGISVPAAATCTSPPAGSTSYAYDQYGNKTSETDPLGNTTRYGYYETYPSGQNPDLNGLLCWEAQPSVTGSGGTCTSPTSPNGAPTGSTAYTYDQYGDQLSKTVNYGASPSLPTYSGNYNNLGEPGYTISPEGQGAGNSQSNPYATTYTYYSWGSLRTKTVPDSTAVTDTYDLADNLIGVAGPANQNENASYGYNADEQRCWSVLALNATGTCATPPANSTVTTFQAGTSAPATVTDPNGHTTTYAYGDPAYPAKPTEVIDPAQNEITWNSYDAYGNVCVSGPIEPPQDSPAQCNPISGDTAAQYNSAGSELASWDASLNETTYAYGNAGYDNLATSSTTPMSQTTNYTYDNDGRLQTTNEPNGTAVSVAYDANGRKCAQAPVSTAIGCTVSGAAGDTVYGYDGANELTTMQDNNGTTGQPPLNTYAYTNGMLTSVSDDNAKTVSYLYGYGGETLCVAYPTGTPSCGTITARGTPSATNAIVNYGYDPALRLTSVTPWTGTAGSNSISYSYSDSLNPTSVSQITYPTTRSETLGYQYDAAGNLKTASFRGPVLNNKTDTFTYNNDEQLSTYSLLGGATSPAVSYDSYKRVTSAQDPGQTNPNNYTITSNGDISKIIQGSTTTQSAAFNPDGGICWSLAGSSSNQCGSAPTGSTAYSYDANGQRTAAATSSTTKSMGWSAFGQLCWTANSSSSSEACNSAPSGATSYSYAGNGLRTSATTGPNTTPFTWDVVRGGSLPLDISDGTNSYIYGPLLFGGTAPIAQISGTTTTFLASIQSGVQDAFTSAGSESERATYSLYGSQTITSGTKVTPFSFQGSYTDPSGFIFLINRYYDPATAQFLSIDPSVAETGLPYSFASDDPLNKADPLGLKPRNLNQCAGQSSSHTVKYYVRGFRRFALNCGNGYQGYIHIFYVRHHFGGVPTPFVLNYFIGQTIAHGNPVRNTNSSLVVHQTYYFNTPDPIDPFGVVVKQLTVEVALNKRSETVSSAYILNDAERNDTHVYWNRFDLGG
jgi:RHS repeat-associated protein